MCDIETLGKRPGCVVLSVALVRFSDYAAVQVNVDIPAQQAIGLQLDAETCDWWRTQDPAAWAAATVNPVQPRAACEYIAQVISWMHGGGDWLLWAQGTDFDPPITGHLFDVVGIARPWQYWQAQDNRTLLNLAGVDKRQYPPKQPHVALHDAIAQTQAANDALRILAGARGLVAA
jgi:hypothetical protein